MLITVIAAVAKNRAIGYRNKLLYHIPEDLAHFKRITLGHSVIMGIHTYYSLPKGALPQRRNIVLTSARKSLPGCDVCHSLQEALQLCIGEDEVFVIGGESVYRQAMPLAHRLRLTVIDDTPLLSDAFFPPYADWKVVDEEKHDGFTFLLLER